VWLASLFPAGAEVTEPRMREVMLQQGDDPRAGYLAWSFCGRRELLRQAAESGYAPAQVALATRAGSDAECLPLLEKASALDDRNALFDLWRWWQDQESGPEKAIDLLRRAAELNQRGAQFYYGAVARAIRLGAVSLVVTGGRGRPRGDRAVH
jgi:TPR repeat protein